MAKTETTIQQNTLYQNLLKEIILCIPQEYWKALSTETLRDIMRLIRDAEFAEER